MPYSNHQSVACPFGLTVPPSVAELGPTPVADEVTVTGGDAVVYLPRERVLMTGDLVSTGTSFMGDGYVPDWIETIAPSTSATAVPRLPETLFANDLDHEPLRAPPVELGVEDLLPRAEVEPTLGHGQDHLVMHEQVLEVRVPVVLTAAVMAVVPGIG